MTPAAPGAGGGTVEVTPATLDITDLAPGAVVAHDVTVTNGSGVPVLVTVTRTEEGALFAGDAPLTLATAWTTTGPSCDGAPVVGADERADLALRVALPEDAGNEYQGLAGRSVVTVTATELPGGTCPGPGVVDPDPGPGSPGGPGGGTPDVPGPGGVGGGDGGAQAAPPAADDLALTGAQAGSLLLTVVLLVSAGVALLRRRRTTAHPSGASS
ncbi:hypothetical protein [Cellulomonas sp.]|uniref:hypothetical protein n=1 Tax=Cellulomonas sp. TaxID=40001 RepID=UPI002D5CCD93|nr:hypothetical protein [Cellulomonas sp.]HYQ76998.1 hypothetical protein [Cellulomonas sp.]